MAEIPWGKGPVAFQAKSQSLAIHQWARDLMSSTSLRSRVSRVCRCAEAVLSLVSGPWGCSVFLWISSVWPRILSLIWVMLSTGKSCFQRLTSLFSCSWVLQRKMSCLIGMWMTWWVTWMVSTQPSSALTFGTQEFQKNKIKTKVFWTSSLC